MAPLTLSERVRLEFAQTDPENLLDERLITESLLANRLIAPERVLSLLNSRSLSSRFITYNQTDGRLYFTLRDIGAPGDYKKHYAPDYAYWLHPDGLFVTVDGATIASNAYSFFPLSMSLDFLVARAEVNPKVVVSGWPVDFRAVVVECGKNLAGQYSALASIKNDEFDKVAKKINNHLRANWGARVIHRGLR